MCKNFRKCVNWTISLLSDNGCIKNKKKGVVC